MGVELVVKWVSCSGIHEVIGVEIGVEMVSVMVMKIEWGGEKRGMEK